MAILDRLTYIALSAVAGMALSSCYTEFEPDLESHPAVCMNSIIESGRPVGVSLSRTYRYTEGIVFDDPFDEIDKIDVEVRDAVVTLYVNGRLMEETGYATGMKGREDIDGLENGYFFDYRPEAGDEIRLVAHSREYGDAESTVEVPDPVYFDNVEFMPSDVTVSGGSSDNISLDSSFTLNFTDPGDKGNYYQVTAEPINTEIIQVGPGEYWFSMFRFNSVNYNLDQIFREHADVLDLIVSGTGAPSFFTDRSISGQAYPLRLSFFDSVILVDNPDRIESLYDVGVRFRLYNISRSYYNWVLYDWVADNSVTAELGSAGLGDIIFGYSNVSTNAGVVMAYSVTDFEYSFRDFVKTTISGSEGD